MFSSHTPLQLLFTEKLLNEKDFSNVTKVTSIYVEWLKAHKVVQVSIFELWIFSTMNTVWVV